jgi:hypothetical protein
VPTLAQLGLQETCKIPGVPKCRGGEHKPLCTSLCPSPLGCVISGEADCMPRDGIRIAAHRFGRADGTLHTSICMAIARGGWTGCA